MMKSRLLGAVCASVFSIITLPSHASLITVLDGQAVYDDVADLTWLANANAGADSEYDDGGSTSDGRMSWSNANNWAASLDINGVTGWRLPDTLQPDPSCNGAVDCTGSEMGNLYNVLGGTGGSILVEGDPTLLALFTNVQANPYWSGTEFAPDTSSVWLFNFFNGQQTSGGKEGSFIWAWAVYSGNASTVPVPAAVWLFGSGLLGLVSMARRKK